MSSGRPPKSLYAIKIDLEGMQELGRGHDGKQDLFRPLRASLKIFAKQILYMNGILRHEFHESAWSFAGF